MMFSSLPPAAVPAAVEAVGGRALTGANLLAGDAEVFAAGWREHTGATEREKMRTRLYRLGSLTPPAMPAGAPRTAGPADRDLLLRWHTEFYEVIGEEPPPTLAETVDDRAAQGDVTLWEAGGEPVSMATRSRPEAGMIRILTVYTPAPWRGRGYGGAATAVATRQALDAGASAVVLFTDLANPTSNGLYQRLGYRPVEDRVVMEFT
jgi:RimJ/RimL family protein N-acetyltransferase